METPYSSVMPITPRSDVVFARGESGRLGQRMERRYLDFVQGWAGSCLGDSQQTGVDVLSHQA